MTASMKTTMAIGDVRRAAGSPRAGWRRMRDAGASLAAVGLLAACHQPTGHAEQPLLAAAAQPPVVAPVAATDAQFGYTDDTGTRLLMLGDREAVDAGKATAMTTAVCSEGREHAIRYLRFQERAKASNGRQSAGNLKNDGGYLYEVVGTAADPGDTCLVVPSDYLRRFPLVRNDFPLAERMARQDATYANAQAANARRPAIDLLAFCLPRGKPSPACQARADLAGAAVDRLQKQVGRPVRLYWLLHSNMSQQAAVVEFEPAGDNLLGALVLAEPERLSIFEMPANRRDGEARGGCWRVDDDCRFNPDEMNVPAVLGARGEQLVFYTTWGAEGQLIVLFQAQSGRLVELRRGYRYHSPL